MIRVCSILTKNALAIVRELMAEYVARLSYCNEQPSVYCFYVFKRFYDRTLIRLSRYTQLDVFQCVAR